MLPLGTEMKYQQPQNGVNRENLAARAYMVVRKRILSRELKGGVLIVEGRLAQELALSRTPLREALRRLAGEGLLIKEGTRQFAVRQVSVTEFFESMRVRTILESEMAGLAAGRLGSAEAESLNAEIDSLKNIDSETQEHWTIDDHVHETIAKAGGNAVAAKIIRDLRTTTRMFEINRPFSRGRADAAEHRAILEAIQSEDRAAAIAAMSDHLKNVANDVMKVIAGE